MTNFSNTDKTIEGMTTIPVHYTLYGDIEAALSRNGATLNELVERTFLEIADIGNSFHIFYHHFTWAFETETLRFSCASLPFEPGGEIHFTVSLVEAPLTVSLDDLPEDTQALLTEAELGTLLKH